MKKAPEKGPSKHGIGPLGMSYVVIIVFGKIEYCPDIGSCSPHLLYSRALLS